ncbi:MAG: 3-phenylpropionate MFS transporter [Rhodospirillales bacterium]
MTSLQLSLRLSILVGAIFMALGLFLPFWPVLLEMRGMDAAEIGILLAVATWIKIVGVPFWGRMADRRGDARSVLLFLALASLAAYLFLGAAAGFFLLLLGHLLLGFVYNPLIPITDSEILRAGRTSAVDYGRVRLWGSCAFVAGNLAGGGLVELDQGRWFLAAILASLLVAAAAAYSLPPAAASRPPPLRGAWRLLLGDRRFLCLVLIAGCLQASHAAYYAVSSLAWLAAGHSETTIALLWAEGVVVEILLLAYSGRLLARFGAAQLLIIAGAAGVLRWSATAATAELSVLVAAQALHALTFAAAHLGAVHLIARSVPSGAAASGQALYTALQGGIMMGLALLAAGFLYEISAAAAFTAMAVLSAMGFVLALLWRRRLAPA